MTTSPAPRRALLAATLALLATSTACGDTSAKILGTSDTAEPPSSNPRVDVFLIRSLTTCVIGNPCVGNTSQCFYLADANGPGYTFSTDGLRFVLPTDPALAQAKQAPCFRATLDDATDTATRSLFDGLRKEVFRDSAGDIDLDLKFHEIPVLNVPFSPFKTGLQLAPHDVEPTALPLLGRDSDFAFTITGYQDPAAGLTPRVDVCLIGNAKDMLGGTPSAWIPTTDRCAHPSVLFAGWMFELYIGRLSLGDYPDLYDSNPRNYPACGRGDPDPTRWFPSYADCTTDPDAPACGKSTCPDTTAFYAHILAKHWPRGQTFNGNYCADGRMDFDETGIDTGGVCDRVGR